MPDERRNGELSIESATKKHDMPLSWRGSISHLPIEHPAEWLNVNPIPPAPTVQRASAAVPLLGPGTAVSTSNGGMLRWATF